MTVKQVTFASCTKNCCSLEKNILNKAFKKCFGVMRQKVHVNKKMLSVVSAGAAAGMGGMDRLRGGGRAAARELAATRDRQVRLHAVTTDLSLNLPPSIALPDGEEYNHQRHHAQQQTAYVARSRFQMRTPDQESEIYQKCVRPPPNRSARESKSPPPYRSSSAGVLASSSSSSGASSEWSGSSGVDPMVMRCHSMSSTSSGMSCKPEVTSNVSSQSAQKTDFLQRTVKIFTGKKSPATSSSQPCVIVPNATAPNRGQTRRDAGPGQKPPV